MTNQAMITELKHQLRVTRYEQGWQWETDDFCSEEFLPSREAAIADFNQFIQSGEAETLQQEVQADPTAEIFKLIDGLEGNLSRSQILRLREQTKREGAGFIRYLDLINQELAPLVSDG